MVKEQSDYRLRNPHNQRPQHPSNQIHNRSSLPVLLYRPIVLDKANIVPPLSQSEPQIQANPMDCEVTVTCLCLQLLFLTFSPYGLSFGIFIPDLRHHNDASRI